MPDSPTIFGARGTEVFAGIPVRDFQVSLDWYQRLFGCAPAFFPNDREAVWAIGERRWIYIIVEPERAGGTIQTIMCDGLEKVIAEIAARGLRFSKEEMPDAGVRKVMYYDPDGNEVGIGRIPAE
ncbi:VOC family protein [Sphingomonas mesophila]|uniref:VOC family protein n=1 Tax=Sphingomonas mesophila TaxID=2303576 RepID=UPI000E57B4AA|nr:VOC family protein [Sphingomonas mesophila]